MSAQPPPPPPPPGPPAPGQAPLRPPPPYIPASQLRPSRAWYWVAGAVGAVFVVASIVLFVSFFSSLVDDLTGPLTDLRAPGQVTVELEAGAERTIYRKERENGAPIANASGRDPTCSVTREGASVEVSDNEIGWTLKRDGDRYRALYDFTAAEGGSYRVACEAANAAQGPAPLAIGESIGVWELIKKAGAALALFFGGLAIAAAIAIVTAVMRDSHKRKLQQQARDRAVAAPPPPPPPPPPA